MHPAEHRSYRELHAATGHLEKHWRTLADRLAGTPQAPPLREGADAAAALRHELDGLIEDRDLYGGPASQAAGRSLSLGRNLVSDRFLERNQAVRLAVLDAQHITTLLPYLARLARTRDDEELAEFCERWTRRMKRVAAPPAPRRSRRARTPMARSRVPTRARRARRPTGWPTRSAPWASGPTAACACSGAADQRAHGPVETGDRAFSSASRTMVSGTPKPTSRLSVAAAKMVVSTRPRPSTAGPPELPERTRPRSDVILRGRGPRP